MPLVDGRQHSEFPAAGQLVMYEIHRPVLAAARGDRDRGRGAS
jgi:hypothetical protein